MNDKLYIAAGSPIIDKKASALDLEVPQTPPPWTSASHPTTDTKLTRLPTEIKMTLPNKVRFYVDMRKHSTLSKLSSEIRYSYFVSTS